MTDTCQQHMVITIMTRDELIAEVDERSRSVLVDGYYVDSDNGEPYLGADFCREHADMVARVAVLETGDACWVSSTSMGSDGHRECEFGGCGKHLNYGGLTDYGVNSALGLTESDPRRCSVYISELELSARSMAPDDPRWELWDHHAKATIAFENARRR